LGGDFYNVKKLVKADSRSRSLQVISSVFPVESLKGRPLRFLHEL